MYVINPEPYSVPSYRIGPFRTKDLAENNYFKDDDSIDKYFDNRFLGKKYVYTEDGRSGISLALKYFKLERDDVVTILTTTSNKYIAKCVTDEIEKNCKWSREFQSKTKIILVNHEFGYAYKGLKDLKRYGLPIIEDCAHSFFTKDSEDSIGKVGDFVIYSFPKIFPIQIGGLLLINIDAELPYSNPIDKNKLRYIKNVLSNYIKERDITIQKRLENYSYLNKKVECLGLQPRFDLEEGTVPGVYMFKTSQLNVDLEGLKVHCNLHGIQSSVFYGEEAYFLPIHQALNIDDLNYFFEVVKSFLK